MPARELKRDIKNGVEFYGWSEENVLIWVMGI
jgi:hypothetical protein